MVSEFRKFSILNFERPFLQWKDSVMPPSPEQLDKRVAKYVDTYLNGGDTAIPLIWDAIKGGASPDQSVKMSDGGTEPLIVKAARHDAFFLVQALSAAGANPNTEDSNGLTAIKAGAKAGSVTITSFLLDRGAEISATYTGAKPNLGSLASSADFNGTASPAKQTGMGAPAYGTNPAPYALAPKTFT